MRLLERCGASGPVRAACSCLDGCVFLVTEEAVAFQPCPVPNPNASVEENDRLVSIQDNQRARDNAQRSAKTRSIGMVQTDGVATSAMSQTVCASFPRGGK